MDVYLRIISLLVAREALITAHKQLVTLNQYVPRIFQLQINNCTDVTTTKHARPTMIPTYCVP